jgi:hypothetical protein
MRNRLTFGLVMALGSAALWVSASPLGAAARADANALRQKVLQIATNGMADTPEPRQTPVTDEEVNAYIQSLPAEDLPQGLLAPQVNILPDGRLSGRATIDLDAIRAAHAKDGAGDMLPLSGKVPVEAVGVLRTGQGVGALTIESVTVSGVVVPKSMLQELIAAYSRSDAMPDGLNLEAPFRLPARIREIRTARGQAVIVQ